MTAPVARLLHALHRLAPDGVTARVPVADLAGEMTVSERRVQQIARQAQAAGLLTVSDAQGGRARGDLAEADRLTRQITHGLTPAGIWDSVRQDYEALQPGITETLDAFWRKPTCPVCHGQQYVRVSFKAGRLPVVVEDHWREISRNSLGVTYHCPRCTTVAGRREVHAAIYEAIP